MFVNPVHFPRRWPFHNNTVKQATATLRGQFLAHLTERPCELLPSLGSVVSKLFTFESSPVKPPGQMNQNLVGSICGRSSIKIAHVVRSINKHGCRAILVNDRSISKKSTTKPLRQMNQHLVRSTYGRSSIKIAHFVLIS